jgi:hypothetical protein
MKKKVKGNWKEKYKLDLVGVKGKDMKRWKKGGKHEQTERVEGVR